MQKDMSRTFMRFEDGCVRLYNLYAITTVLQ